VEHYRLEEIADGVVAAIAMPDGGGRANAAIVRLDDRTLVFDTGMTPEAGRELRDAAERLGAVRFVVNSHWHGDHIRGNQAFAGAEILATTRTKELIETRAAEQLAEQQAADWETLLASAPEGPDHPRLDKSFEARAASVRRMAATIADVELHLPTRTFEDRLELAPSCELITLGGGHTESDAFLVLAERRVAVVGDLLAVELHPWLGAGDPDRWIEILAGTRSRTPSFISTGLSRQVELELGLAFAGFLILMKPRTFAYRPVPPITGTSGNCAFFAKRIIPVA
jgi:glyoxylase-like metal-dependent hydrolase (beta-lactamase superfamily II)